MGSKKIWKISNFSGGLNSYSNSYDIKSNEFAEFEDVSSSKRGIAKPLGSVQKSTEVLPLHASFDTSDLSSIIQGRGAHNYNVDYTYFPAQTNNILIDQEIYSNASDSDPGRLEVRFNKIQWIFDTAMPTSGTLTVQAKIK